MTNLSCPDPGTIWIYGGSASSVMSWFVLVSTEDMGTASYGDTYYRFIILSADGWVSSFYGSLSGFYTSHERMTNTSP